MIMRSDENCDVAASLQCRAVSDNKLLHMKYPCGAISYIFRPLIVGDCTWRVDRIELQDRFGNARWIDSS
jgi:hypothetical protein